MGSSARKKRARKRANMGRGAPEDGLSTEKAGKLLTMYVDKGKGGGAAVGSTTAGGRRGDGVAQPAPLSRAERRKRAQNHVSAVERMLEPSTLVSAVPTNRSIRERDLAASRKRKRGDANVGDESSDEAADDDDDDDEGAGAHLPPRRPVLAGNVSRSSMEQEVREELGSSDLVSRRREGTVKLGQTTPDQLWGPGPASGKGKRKRPKRGSLPPSHTRSSYQPSALPAVVAPSHGESYNPDKKSHSVEVDKAVAAAQRVFDEAQRLKKATRRQQFPFKLRAPLEGSDEDSDDDNDEQIDEAVKAKGKRKNFEPADFDGPERKTRQQRAKEKARKQAARVKRHQRIQKLKERDLNRARELAAEVDKTLRKRNMQLAAKKKAAAAADPVATRRLGAHRYEEPHAAVVLPEQLHGSLRALEPAPGQLGAPSPMEAHFKRLQRRNVLEPTVGQRFARRYKLRVYNKRNLD